MICSDTEIGAPITIATDMLTWQNSSLAANFLNFYSKNTLKVTLTT